MEEFASVDSFFTRQDKLSTRSTNTHHQLVLTVNKKREIMRAILSTIAIIVVIGWAIGYFGYHTGGLFHLILVIALIAIVLQLIPGRRD